MKQGEQRGTRTMSFSSRFACFRPERVVFGLARAASVIHDRSVVSNIAGLRRCMTLPTETTGDSVWVFPSKSWAEATRPGGLVVVVAASEKRHRDREVRRRICDG